MRGAAALGVLLFASVTAGCTQPPEEVRLGVFEVSVSGAFELQAAPTDAPVATIRTGGTEQPAPKHWLSYVDHEGELFTSVHVFHHSAESTTIHLISYDCPAIRTGLPGDGDGQNITARFFSIEPGAAFEVTIPESPTCRGGHLAFRWVE